MTRSILTICVSVLALLAACQEAAKPTPGPALYCYVGGTMNPAMEEIVKLYEQRTGQKVELDPSDSGESMIKAKQVQRGDLIVVHDPFHGALVHGDMSLAGYVMATMEPVIVVPKGNTTIKTLEDLAKPGVKVVVTDPDYSTLGHINQIMFRKAKIADAIKANIVNQPRSGGEAANAVILGKADAAIVWNAVAFLRKDKLDSIAIQPALRPVPEVDGIASATYGPLDMSRIQVTIDVLSCSKLEKAARAFAEFTVSKDAAEIWAKQGFSAAPAGDGKIYDKAAGVGLPAKSASGAASGKTLLVLAGAGLQKAVDELAKEFSQTTGAKIETSYGGSGQLIANLQLRPEGDVFIPGDIGYVERAEEKGLVASKAVFSYFVPVILVKKGNPDRILTVADLARPGVKLGLGDPDKCQVGLSSQQIFAKNKVDAEAIKKNLVFNSATVNELGLQVTVGKVDATIVWDAVAAIYADKADIVAIPPEQNETTRVAAAVLKGAKEPQLAQQFVDFLKSPKAVEILKANKYRTEPPEAAKQAGETPAPQAAKPSAGETK